jgi:hypothetical protein
LLSLAVAVVASAVLPAVSLAGTYGPARCSLNNGWACRSAERHTYNDNRAYAPGAGWAYIASWLTNPRTGTDINVVYGYGTAYAYYRNNTDVFLDGYWGNYSGSSPLTVDGTFNY